MLSASISVLIPLPVDTDEPALLITTYCRRSHHVLDGGGVKRSRREADH
jgi:hypothetical protein